MLRRQVHFNAIPLLEDIGGRWYATVQDEVVGCVLPRGEFWRFLLLAWDGQGRYMKVAEGDGQVSADAAYEMLAAERLKMLPPLH